LARKNLLQLISHHDTDSARHPGLFYRDKMLPPVRITFVNDTLSALLMSSLLRDFLVVLQFLEQFGLGPARQSGCSHLGWMTARSTR